MCNQKLVNHIFSTENVDVVFHLAAKTHVGEHFAASGRLDSVQVQKFKSSNVFIPPPRSELSFESPAAFQRVNVDGTAVLLQAAHQAQHRPQRFVYVSTDEVYGASLEQVSGRPRTTQLDRRLTFACDVTRLFCGPQVFDESCPVRPSNPYSATKAAAEFLVRSYWDKYKVLFPVHLCCFFFEGGRVVKHSIILC